MLLRRRHLQDAVTHAAAAEMSGPDIFAWIPVFMALGVLGYFSMMREPDGLALGLLLVGLLTAAWYARRTDTMFRTLMALSLFVAGAGLAKWQTDRLATPLLRQAGTFELSGRVADIVPGEKRSRVVLRKVRDLAAVPQPLSGVQLSAFNQHIAGLRIGDTVWLRARLEPLSGALIPNGYDFRRAGYFKGLSARGFSLGEIVPELQFEATSGIALADRLTRIRQSVAARLKSALPGEAGALASALLVGLRSGISDDTEEALRNSGLAHILAISGLHMALVTALLFGSIRLVAAFARTVSARYEVKKWAAAAALVGALLYLGLSGAGISAQRAFLMAAVFLLAIICDRAALTMRNVALAAIAIMLFQPAAVLSPGFQMSFMAVIALVAVYRRDGTFNRLRMKSRQSGVLRAMLVGVMALAVTSIVAGFATAPFAVHHFYQFAVYGLIGNLAAMPIVGFVVMPAGLVSLLVMPFGLETLPLKLMGAGLDLVVGVAERVSGLSGAISVPGQQSAIFTLLLALALISLCLMRTRLRYAVATLCLGTAVVVSSAAQAPPVLLVAPDGKMIAGFADSQLEFRGRSRNSFTGKIWLGAFGDKRDPETVLNEERAGQSCDRTGCLFNIRFGDSRTIQIATINRIEAMFEACAGDAAIIISSVELTFPCASPERSGNLEKTIFDPSFLAERGAVLLTTLGDAPQSPRNSTDVLSARLAGLGLQIQTSLPASKRPWN